MVVCEQKTEDSCGVVVKDMWDKGCVMRRRIGQGEMYTSRVRQPLQNWGRNEYDIMKEGESRMALQRRINVQLVCKGVGNVTTLTT